MRRHVDHVGERAGRIHENRRFDETFCKQHAGRWLQFFGGLQTQTFGLDCINSSLIVADENARHLAVFIAEKRLQVETIRIT